MVEYQRKVDTHLIPTLGQIPPQQLTTAILNAHYQQLLARGTGPRTVQYVHATIRKALNDAVRWGLLVRNPAQHAASPTPRRTELQTWTAQELRQFLDSVQGPAGEFLLASVAPGGMTVRLPTVQ